MNEREMATGPESGGQKKIYPSQIHFKVENFKSQALNEKLLDILDPIPTTNLRKESTNSRCGPCPKCGGDDRFVMKANGKWFCRHCHPEQGDLIDYHRWIDGFSFSELCKKYLGDNGKKQADNLSYLSLERKISTTVVDKYVKAGKLFSLNYKGKPAIGAVYATLEGKTTDSGGVKVMQFIPTDGSKKAFKSGCKAGEPLFFIAGDLEKADNIVVVESVINALTIADIDKSAAAVAIGGSTLVKKLEVLRPYKEKIILAFDNDEAGRKATQGAVNILGGCHEVQWSGDDPKGLDLNDLLKQGQPDRVTDLIVNAKWVETETMGPEEEILEAKSRDFLFVHVSDLLSKPKPVPWLIKEVLPQNCFASLFGPAGELKSFIALSISLSIATKNEFLGFPIHKQGPVFYLAGEGFFGIPARLRAWMLYNNVDDSSIIPFFTSNQPAQLLDENSASQVTKAIEVLQADHCDPLLVVVDTLNRNFGPGDENSTADMTAFIAALDKIRCRFNCAILLVHHSGLSATDRSRGSSALRAALDLEFKIEKHKDNIRKLSCTKSKDFEPLQEIFIEPKQILLGWYDSEDGEELDSLVLEKVDAPVAGPSIVKVSGAKRIALEALKRACFDKNEMENIGAKNRPTDISSLHSPVHLDVWRDEAYRSGITASTDQASKQKAFKRAVSGLLDMGLVGCENDYYFPCL